MSRQTFIYLFTSVNFSRCTDGNNPNCFRALPCVPVCRLEQSILYSVFCICFNLKISFHAKVNNLAIFINCAQLTPPPPVFIVCCLFVVSWLHHFAWHNTNKSYIINTVPWLCQTTQFVQTKIPLCSLGLQSQKLTPVLCKAFPPPLTCFCCRCPLYNRVGISPSLLGVVLFGTISHCIPHSGMCCDAGKGIWWQPL